MYPLFVFLHILVIIAFSVYFFLRHRFSFWIERGVPGPPPNLSNFGNVLHLYGRDPKVAEIDLMHTYGTMYGYYLGTKPVLTVIEPELIKKIFVKDFNLWPNRRVLPVFHDIVNINIFFAETAEWKQSRNLARQMFTSAKLRAKTQIIEHCVANFSKHLSNLVENGGKMNTKISVTGFTVDVIASSIFATKTELNYNCGTGLPSKALTIFNPRLFSLISFLTMPKWVNRLTQVEHFFNVDCLEYVISFLREILKQRKATNRNSSSESSNDLMNFLLNNAHVYDNEFKNNTNDDLDLKTQSKTKVKLSDNEIITMCLIFFLAGFETTALTITYAIYELATNPDIQMRLNAELNQALEGVNKFSEEYYEIVQNQIPYMDAIIKETLRKYPPLMRVERRLCAAEYKLTEQIVLHKDQLIEVPLVALHYREDFFPSPHQFNPDRFMPENKHLLVPYSFMPFGHGPRNCLGMRAADQVIKICLAHIFRQYRFVATAETPKNLQFCKYKFNLNPEPFQVKVEKRQSQPVNGA